MNIMRKAARDMTEHGTHDGRDLTEMMDGMVQSFPGMENETRDSFVRRHNAEYSESDIRVMKNLERLKPDDFEFADD